MKSLFANLQSVTSRIVFQFSNLYNANHNIIITKSELGHPMVRLPTLTLADFHFWKTCLPHQKLSFSAVWVSFLIIFVAKHSGKHTLTVPQRWRETEQSRKNYIKILVVLFSSPSRYVSDFVFAGGILHKGSYLTCSRNLETVPKPGKVKISVTVGCSVVEQIAFTTWKNKREV